MSGSIKLAALLSVIIMVACTPTTSEKTGELIIDSAKVEKVVKEMTKDTVVTEEPLLACANDSLNALADLMAGIADSNSVYREIQSSSDFKAFSQNFDKRWMNFDSTRLTNLRTFRDNELSKVVKTPSTLFYPFSGPDILYAQTFFPEADKYVMIGLEPVGSLPHFNVEKKDSMDIYYAKVNTSLNAILKFSFFRTQSMKNDLKNTEVDGTLHLLILFLKRTGNAFCSAKPVTVDSTGNVVYEESFASLKKKKTNTRGLELKFTDVNKKPKTLYYFSLNAADGGLKSNTNFVNYLKSMGTINAYLKGASYLMHKSYFSIIRNVILEQSEQVIQDDSGISFHYFTDSDHKWNYSLYGQYTKPIPMFKEFYQKDLDSLYKQQGAKEIGFGIGYNFKDKNSNLLIATKQH
jgi:hypothetical protein